MLVKLSAEQIYLKGVVIGHNRRFREKIMNYSILITRDLIDFFSSTKIINSIRQTETILEEIGVQNGKFFVGTQNTACFMSLKKRSKNNLFSFISEKWKGGTFSNFKQIRLSLLNYLLVKEKENFEAEFQYLSKKELLSIYKNYKEETYFIGISDLVSCPDLIFSGSVKKDNYMVKESNNLEIPVIGIVDTDTKPDGISYVIPGNDESVESIMLLLEYCLKYFINGLKIRLTFFLIKKKDEEEEERKKLEQQKLEQRKLEQKRKEILSKLKQEHLQRRPKEEKKNIEEKKKKNGRTYHSRKNDWSRFGYNRIGRSRSGDRSSFRLSNTSIF